MAKRKTEEDYLEDLKVLAKEAKVISAKRTRIRNKLNLIRTNKAKEFEETINWGDPKSITKKQWQHILYHWHDSVEYHYKITTDYLYSLGIHTNGIGGGKDNAKVRQHHLSIHSSHDVDKYKEFYFLTKSALKYYKSCVDDTLIYDIGLLVNMFGKSWEHHGNHLEIRKSDDMCRFVDSYYPRDNDGKWMEMDKALELIKKYQKHEIDDDDDCF